MIDPKLLAVLANPNHPDRPPLLERGDELVCSLTGETFPVVEGIPRLLPESARPLGSDLQGGGAS